MQTTLFTCSPQYSCSFLVPVRIFVFIRSCLRVLKTVQTPNFLFMLIKLLVLPLFSVLHSFFQPFSFITSLPACVYMSISSISVYISPYQTCLCTLSSFSWQRSRNRNILHCCFDASSSEEFKNYLCVCYFCVCLHAVTGNSFTQGSQIPSWHITDWFKPMATARIRNEIFPCMLWLYSKISVLYNTQWQVGL